jgi:hypothetical protein
MPDLKRPTDFPRSMDTNQKLTTHDWRLSEALYTALHQWPIIILFCLAGALLGWAASYLWPPTYRTRAEVTASLNPYRAYSDTQFFVLANPQYTNIDDYKNWQMSQLSAAIFTDDIIQKTLDDLRQEDSYWNDISLSRLRSMLRAEWRTAGIWTLLADSRSAKRSNQAVRAWSRNAVSGVKEAIFAAEQLIQVDDALRAVVTEQAKTALLQDEYLTTQKSLQEWLGSASSLPQDQPLQPTERWRLLYLTARVAQFAPGWVDILNNQPVADASPEAYVNWINQIIVAMDKELPFLAQREEYLGTQQKLLSENYQDQLAASLGLSPNLVIKSLDKSSPEVIRPTALLILIGTITGLLVWAVWLFAWITRQKLRD